MRSLYVDVTFDFDDQFLQEKEVFLDYLSSEKWISLESDRNWRIGFNNGLFPQDKLDIIKKDLEIASKISKIKAVDYAIILNDAFYFDTIY